MASKAPDRDRLRATAWHALDAEQACERLASAAGGLDGDEAKRRLEAYGPNELPEEQRPGLARVFARQFTDPLIYILLIAGLVSLAIGSLNNAVFIFAVLLLNASVGTWQEYRAESSARSLQSALRIRARALRDGEAQDVEATELVPGDVVCIESGQTVPADLRLLASDNLHADESMLTGESMPVHKSADEGLDDDTPLGERTTLLHAGSAVLDGGARGIVCRTGDVTEIGRIARSLSEREGGRAPLVIKLERFTRQIALVILAAIALLSCVQLWQGAGAERIFFLAVALAVSAIPAGLPVAITVAMSIASNRMARRHVIVRELPAVEGLGACTLIASDKTGTLTENVLTAKRLELCGDGAFEVAGEGYDLDGDVTRAGDGDGEDGDAGEGAPDEDARAALERLARSCALCNEGELERGAEAEDGEGDSGEVHARGDSVDIAFLVLAAKLGVERGDLLDEHEAVAALPFESSRRFAAAFHRHDDTVIAHVKGAAEAVAGMCRDVDEEALAETEEALAERGYRVLAIACGKVGEAQGDDYDEDDLDGLELLGLVALVDPIREGVREAIGRCESAGVRVCMITGDHPSTGLAIARDLGIADDGEEAVVTGKDLARLAEDDDDEAFAQRVREARVFARVEPTQKTDIVETLQQAGHFVAVTGDGVNDAPALKAAHIGVAMGQAGTDVARRAAALILTDDNFASIVNGIEEGRGAYDNVRKVTWLLLATGAAEVLLFFLAIFSGMPLPLTPVQLLWLNLVTNGIQDVALAFEDAEPGVLERKPRPPDQPVFDRQMIRQTLLSGGYIGLVAFAVFAYLLSTGMDEDAARNLLLLLMVLFENVHTFSCRSETRSLFRVRFAANRLLLGAVILAHGVHIAAMFTPGLRDVLAIAPVAPVDWTVLALIALTLLAFDEGAKLVHARMGAATAS